MIGRMDKDLQDFEVLRFLSRLPNRSTSDTSSEEVFPSKSHFCCC